MIGELHECCLIEKKIIFKSTIIQTEITTLSLNMEKSLRQSSVFKIFKFRIILNTKKTFIHSNFL